MTVWLTTCRNHQALKQGKEKVLSGAGCGGKEASDRTLNVDDAIRAWRVHVRSECYLNDGHSPLLTSLSGDTLHQGLIQFTFEANRKRSYRMLDMILHQLPPADPTLGHPVYVLKEEEEKYGKYSALSICDIDNKILDLIEVLDECSKQAFLDMFMSMSKRNSKKEQHIVFLEEITTLVTAQLEKLTVPFEKKWG